MECPNCHSGNPPDAKFCGECGHQFNLTCSECGTNNPAKNKFCIECGSIFNPVKAIHNQITEPKRLSVFPFTEIMLEDSQDISGEGKHIVIPFAESYGYNRHFGVPITRRIKGDCH